MFKLSAIIRASGLVISQNRLNSCRACFGLPKSPKLFPIIRIVSNLPSLELISEIDLTPHCAVLSTCKPSPLRVRCQSPRHHGPSSGDRETIFHPHSQCQEPSLSHIVPLVSLGETSPCTQKGSTWGTSRLGQ